MLIVYERKGYDMKKDSRTLRKKDKVHQDILQVASKIIGEKGAGNVTFEALSVEADVARKTIYNHFENKAVLLEALIYPICEHAKAYLAEKTDQKQIGLDDIWEYCINLWRDSSLNAELLYQITEQDYPQIQDAKKGFIILFEKLLMRIEGFNLLDKVDIAILADVIYTSYLPVLGALRTLPSHEMAFKAGMNGMLTGIYELMIKNEKYNN